MERRKFSKAFKIEAVRLMERGDTSPTVLARELRVRRNQLYKWQHQLRRKGEQAFAGPGPRSRAQLTDVEALQRRVAELEEENEILKKAQAYFSADPK